jgi:hypothetical protein
VELEPGLMLVSRPIRRDLEEQEDRIQGGRSRVRASNRLCRQGVQLRRGRRRGVLTRNSCEGLTEHDETRTAERGAILLTGRVAERQRQKEGSAPLPAHASPTAHQCKWRCSLNLCYPVGRGREAFLPLGISPSRRARSDRRACREWRGEER